MDWKMQPVIRCLSSFRYLKVHALIGSSYILACSPENSAADLLAERLLPHVDKGDLFRIYAASRPWDFVPQKLRVNSLILSTHYYTIESFGQMVPTFNYHKYLDPRFYRKILRKGYIWTNHSRRDISSFLT